MCIFRDRPLLWKKRIPKSRPIYGYRQMTVRTGVDGGTVLSSPFVASARWYNLQFTSHCEGARSVSPGIHVYEHKAPALSTSAGNITVRVKIWGTVYAYGRDPLWGGSTGYLAQHCEIVALERGDMYRHKTVKALLKEYPHLEDNRGKRKRRTPLEVFNAKEA